MQSRYRYILPFLCGAVLLFSCKNNPTKGHGPIVLGDSSTIVTETDSQKLRDFVTDLQPTATTTTTRDTPAAKPQQDTVQKTAAVAPTPVPTVTPQPQHTQATPKGITAAFTDLSVTIPNTTAKGGSNQNLQRANGATYQLASGTLNGNTLNITGNVTKVSQRYQTMVVLKDDDMGTLQLDELASTTDWTPLKGRGSVYNITGLDANHLNYDKASNREIRDAVTKACRKHRMSRKKEQDWVDDVRSVRAVNQKPLTLTVRSVMWKIDGKDAKGRNFSKQVRIDLPM